jgi:uncharacterized protein (TIGR02594 family)
MSIVDELKQIDWALTTKPWMVKAIRELGVKEKEGSGDNPRIIEYHAKTSLKAQSDDVAWCSAFVNWCIDSCGIKTTRDAMARSWLSWGRSCDYEQGCVVVLKRGTGWQGHVGFAVKKVGPVVWILGGNQNDEVNITAYPTWRVLGYRKDN